MADLTPFERDFLRSLPREIVGTPSQPNPLSKAERAALVRLQSAGLITVQVESAYRGRALQTDAGRDALRRAA